MDEKPKPNPEDISSYSNFDEVIQKHVDLDVTINFKKQQLTGEITTTYEILNIDLKKIILDLNGPEITSIDYINEDLDEIPLSFDIYDKNEYKALGTPLTIFLDDFEKDHNEEYLKCIKEKKITIKIGFISSEKCNGIQYLTKEQTYTKNYPFMFTQCEAILCRTIFPIQDTPSVKSTYKVKTSIELPLTFLFSGIIKSHFFDSKTSKKIMTFEQKIPIPSYLVSFVAGELEFGKISKRCGVWTEKGLAKKACEEFTDAEKYIEIAEEYLKHPYEWKIYNIVILPFSFPYGGMENPNLTFATPALLAGDKSMANVIGHEISHSWTGNLVTNKNWKNFWVNEGFTTFLERKLSSALLGEDMANLESIIGNNRLLQSIKMVGEDSDFSCLNPNYEGIDPDDGFSNVPYEKGYQFLVYLENEVGDEHFREIMSRYIDTYKYQSVDFYDFKGVYEKYVNEKFSKKNAKKLLDGINWEKWINEKGYPSYEQKYETKYLQEIDDLKNQFLSGEVQENANSIFKEWHTNVKLVFLDDFNKNIENIDIEVIKKMKNELELAEIYNDDIKGVWYEIALKKGLKEEINNIKLFLQTHGRMKYLRPIYISWMQLNVRQARRFFDENKYLYHPMARRIIQGKFDKM